MAKLLLKQFNIGYCEIMRSPDLHVRFPTAYQSLQLNLSGEDRKNSCLNERFSSLISNSSRSTADF